MGGNITVGSISGITESSFDQSSGWREVDQKSSLDIPIPGAGEAVFRVTRKFVNAVQKHWYDVSVVDPQAGPTDTRSIDVRDFVREVKSRTSTVTNRDFSELRNWMHGMNDYLAARAQATAAGQAGDSWQVGSIGTSQGAAIV